MSSRGKVRPLISISAAIIAATIALGGWTTPAHAKPAAAEAVPASGQLAIPPSADCDTLKSRLPQLRARNVHRALCYGTTNAKTDRPRSAALPSFCSGVSNGWAWNRSQMCGRFDSYVEMYDVFTGAIIGRTDFRVEFLTTASWNSLNFVDQMWLARGESYGEMENDDDMTFQVNASCDYGCTGNYEDSPVTWDYGDNSLSQHTFNATVGAGTYAFARTSYEVWFDHEDAVDDTETPMTLTTAEIRCDRVSYWSASGCVFGQHRPTVRHAGLGAVTTHVRQAQAAGHPGAPGGTPLRYDPSNANEDIRRQQACGGFTPNPGEQCDEYPFARSWEGGTGSSVYSVPGTDNSAQGGVLSSFLQNNRVLNGENYHVDPYALSNY